MSSSERPPADSMVIDLLSDDERRSHDVLVTARAVIAGRAIAAHEALAPLAPPETARANNHNWSVGAHYTMQALAARLDAQDHVVDDLLTAIEILQRRLEAADK